MEKKDKKIERSLFRKTINGFIMTSIGLIALFLLFLGFSQTFTFRNFLKKEIVTSFEASTSGTLQIGSLEGSLLTSIILKNTSIAIKADTLFSAKKLEIAISPLELFFKRIYIRKIELSDANFSLLELEQGKWNLDLLTASKDSLNSAEPQQIPDTTIIVEEKNDFQFSFQLNKFRLRNVSFVRKTYEHLHSNETYTTMNYDNFVVNNINMQAALIADIAQPDIRLLITDLSASPNLKSFKLNRLSGLFHLTNKVSEIRKLEISTDSSYVSLSAKIDSLNLFAPFEMADIKDYPVKLELEAAPFHFDDLSTFLEVTDFLKGAPRLNLVANGTYGNMDIQKLDLGYENSALYVTGKLQKLHTPSKLFMDLNFENSSISYSDVNKLLSNMELSFHDDFALENFALHFKGEALKFDTEFAGTASDGKLEFDGSFDFYPELTKYNFNFKSEHVDLFPIMGTKTDLNTSGSIVGEGFAPINMNTTFKLYSDKSSLNGYFVDSLNLDFIANSKQIDLNLLSNINGATVDIEGQLDLREENEPGYNLVGYFNDLNLSSFINDNTLLTSLNFDFKAKGKNLDVDKLLGDFHLGISNSLYKQYTIDTADVDIKLTKENNHREISLKSDFLDFNINGEFSLQKAISLLAYQANKTTDIISGKFAEMAPDVSSDSTAVAILSNKNFANNQVEFDFDFQFKDFALIATILEEEELDIAGSGFGYVRNDSLNFSINTELALDYFYTLNQDELVYISNLDLNFNFSRDNQSDSFENLFGALSLNSDRFFIGTKLKNLATDIIFNQSNLFFNMSGEVDSLLTTELEGNLAMSPGRQTLSINDILLDYNGIEWNNSDTLRTLIYPDSISIDKFRLACNNSALNISGIYVPNGEQDISLEVRDFSSTLLNKMMFGSENNTVKTVFHLDSHISGTLSDPSIDANLYSTDVKSDGNKLGYLDCKLNYLNSELFLDMKFLESNKLSDTPVMSIYGSIPVYLGTQNISERFDQKKGINLKLFADNFDLSSMGDLIPYTSKLQGYFNSDLDITGSFEKIKYDGFAKLDDASFFSTYTKLQYGIKSYFSFDENMISIDTLNIFNIDKGKAKETFRIKGNMALDGFLLDQAKFNATGKLALLKKDYSPSFPQLTGDMFVSAKDPIRFNYNKGKSDLKGTFLLDGTSLEFTPAQSNNTLASKDFTFVFVVDSTKLDKQQQQFDDLMARIAPKNIESKKNSASKNFDYDITLKIDDHVDIKFVLAPSFNQYLFTSVTGDLVFKQEEGNSSTQGELTLLNESHLEFYKTFESVGAIRFDSDITDPFIDVIATYSFDYAPISEDPNEQVQTIPSAVKLKLKGYFSELGKNLASDESNIAAYVGQQNVDNNTPSEEYDAADAISFIVFGQPFREIDYTKAKDNLTNALLSPLISDFVNSKAGDAIRRIELGTSGENTRINVSGRIKNVRYTVGGTDELFNNINRANLKVEYLVNPKFIIRVERKDPVVNTTGTEEKINEFGVKYRFVF